MDTRLILTDGPPGTGCATISSVSGADAVLVVIEPSLTSLHDAARVIELVKGFNIPAFALINKSDINPEISDQIESFLQDNAVPLLGMIPFDPDIVKALINGRSFVEFAPDSEASRIIRSVWSRLEEILEL